MQTERRMRKLKRKAVSGIMLTLISISMLTLAFNIQLVRAEPTTWTVDDSGGADFTKIQDAINSADPGDTIFVYNGTYYEHPYVAMDDLTIVGENKNNTIIDGSGYGAVLNVYAKRVAVRGFRVQNGGWGWYYQEGSGIYLGGPVLYKCKSCNISDNIVSNCRFGISIWRSRDNTIKGNTISNTEGGISFHLSRDNTVVGNVISNGVLGSYPPAGIQVWYSNDNTINGNTISDANQGIVFDFSEDNTVVGNVISNGVQFGGDPPYGIHVWHSIDNTIVGNIVSNISYTGIRLSHATGNVVTGNIVSNTSVGISASFEASSNTIIGNNVSKNEVGIEVWNSNYNTITLNEISNNNNGIWHDSSLGTTIHNNNITNNNWDGISLSWSSDNTISGNNIANNDYGISLYESSDNTISGNNITTNHWNSISLYWFSNYNTISGNNITANNWNGIHVYWSSNNTISGNNITNSWVGIYLYGSSNNTISGNNIANNLYGIYLSWSSNNTIYHNNFLDNTFFQAYCYESTNVWDNGYLSGGNYWIDYTGVDANSDGIGDTPYVIDANNQDNYPLMEPWSPTPTIPTMTKTLVRTVLSWNLPKGTENSLTSKLKGALHLLDIGNENGAIHKLMELINQAEALRDKKLINEQADYLISEAQKIIDLIEE